MWRTRNSSLARLATQLAGAWVLGLIFTSIAFSHTELDSGMRFVEIQAKTKEDRTRIANTGVSIEAYRTGSVWGFANQNAIARLKKEGIRILGDFDFTVGRGGHETLDFPTQDARFHNYQETYTTLKSLQSRHADITKLTSIGKSIEGRDIWALNINTSQESLKSGFSNKPGVIYMGNHHAREHLSLEIPLMFTEYLLNNRADARVAALLDQRDIWIIPMVNPDGAEYDIATGRYKMWRKNRRDNKDGTYGVDLNRNYGYMWGTGGSDTDTSSDVYMGVEPFSEPETKAIKAFVEARTNAKVLLSFHTFSELILYPWGHSYDPIKNERDRQVFDTMAKTMAQWNRYTPQQASDLYIASGDTTDWAYGERGIFAFTFELSPKSMWNGGFYPGAGVIDKVFQDNLKPCLYLLENAADPYAVIGSRPTGFLKNYVEPKVPSALTGSQLPW